MALPHDWAHIILGGINAVQYNRLTGHLRSRAWGETIVNWLSSFRIGSTAWATGETDLTNEMHVHRASHKRHPYRQFCSSTADRLPISVEQTRCRD